MGNQSTDERQAATAADNHDGSGTAVVSIIPKGLSLTGQLPEFDPSSSKTAVYPYAAGCATISPKSVTASSNVIV